MKVKGTFKPNVSTRVAMNNDNANHNRWELWNCQALIAIATQPTIAAIAPFRKITPSVNPKK
ncbi:hypothetical protein WN50_36200 [Limnoraphis robusta CS-951]|uniref:Uncharacterized protein n=1 Tax=Limnoraphis robusta CS-951 TaxID=1637645 RepID=A0A0J9EVK9_9CYAN|nr:hypothetical protein WN50_36200 [Limnoraphis robusta CS-951]